MVLHWCRFPCSIFVCHIKIPQKNGEDCAGDGYADLTAKTLSLFLARCHTFRDPLGRQKGLKMSLEDVI